MKQAFPDRVKTVLAGYTFHLVSRGSVRATGASVRSYRVTNQSDPRRSYVVTVGAINGCSCVAFQRDGHTCKHLVALANLRGESPAVPPAAQPAPVHRPVSEWADSEIDDIFEEETAKEIKRNRMAAIPIIPAEEW